MRTFLYLHADDVDSARSFYGGVLGLDEIYYSDRDGSVGYRAGELQIAITRHPDGIGRSHGWSRQLGWDGGSQPTPSWGLELPGADFCRVVEAARSRGLATFADEPRWVGYWSFPVKDPMGNTVEFSTPAEDAWPPSV